MLISLIILLYLMGVYAFYNLARTDEGVIPSFVIGVIWPGLITVAIIFLCLGFVKPEDFTK